MKKSTKFGIGELLVCSFLFFVIGIIFHSWVSGNFRERLLVNKQIKIAGGELVLDRNVSNGEERKYIKMSGAFAGLIVGDYEYQYDLIEPYIGRYGKLVLVID